MNEAINAVRKQYPQSLCIPESTATDWRPGMQKKYQVLANPHEKIALGKGFSTDEAWEDAATNMRASTMPVVHQLTALQQRFEFWACEHFNTTLDNIFMRKDPTNPTRYIHEVPQNAWEGWQGLADRARASYSGAKEDRNKVITEHFEEIGSVVVEKLINRAHQFWMTEGGKVAEEICSRLYDVAYDTGNQEQQRMERMLMEAQEEARAKTQLNTTISTQLEEANKRIDSLKQLLANFKQFDGVITGKIYSTVDVRAKWRGLDAEIDELLKGEQVVTS